MTGTMTGRTTLTGAAFLGLLLFAAPAEAEPRHGMSTFGDLKYGSDFTQFDYVNVNAPVGGTVRLRDLGSFDNLNPFILKGIRLRGMGAVAMFLPFESLMTGTADEPDSLYGLIAESVDVGPGKAWVTFKLRPEARWHDGSPITVDDVIYSFNILKEQGRPSYRIQYADIASVEAVGADSVTFTFTEDSIKRDLPAVAAGMPILSKDYYETVEFDKTTFDPPMGSGPYRIKSADPGRSIVYERVREYWGWHLPVNRGRYNFGEIRFDFYRDRTVAFEAFKAGDYDFREEFTSKTWATGYDFPAVADGRVIKVRIPDQSPANRQWFVLNTRLAKLSDPRVRQAVGLTFDFEWTNENLFYGIYDRLNSIYQNTPMAAQSPPNEAEIALLEPHRDNLPAGLFEGVMTQLATDGSGNIRESLRTATRLLEDAGWTVEDGELRNQAGERLELEFLLISPSFERIIAPMVTNLERLGIAARIRIVDSAQYANRLQSFDFDITTIAFGTPMTPGIGERNFWGSAAAAAEGSINYGGIADPVIDDLLEHLAAATDRTSLTVAARAIDRVLMWNHYLIPQWFRSDHTVAYWAIFGRPDNPPPFALGFLDTWWIDEAKLDALRPD